MAWLTILVVENQFAEMRDGNDMPLVLQFAHRLSLINPQRAPEEEYQMQLQLFH